MLMSFQIPAIACKAFREEDGLQPRLSGKLSRSSAPCTGRAGVAYLGSSEIGYSLRVRGLLGAGSRSALPLRFSVIFEYGGLIP